MSGKIIVSGKKNQEIYYESNFFDNVIEEIVSQLANFIKYNPDDLNKEILKKIVSKGFSNMPDKTIGPVHLKGEELISVHLSF